MSGKRSAHSSPLFISSPKINKMAKLTLTLFPNLKKISKKTKLIPIYARFYYLGKKADKNLEQYISNRELLHWNNLLGRLNIKDHKVNIALDKLDTKFSNFKLTTFLENDNYCAATIRDLIIPSKITEIENQAIVQFEITPLKYIERFLDNFVFNSSDLTSGTKKNYLTAYKHFRNFCEINDYIKLPISKFDIPHALSFHSYLLNSYEKIGKRGMLRVTATGRIKQLRTIFNQAHDEKLITYNPFKKIKNTNTSVPRKKLNPDQIRSIFNADFSSIPVLNTYRDLFVFSAITGLSYIDTVTLKKSSLYTANNSLCLLINRTKTSQVTQMFLPELAVKIIEKYKNCPECKIKGTLLPPRSNQKVNAYLKILADKCEIDINLIFHLARHAFRGIIRDAKIVEPLLRKTLMGHSTIRDIDATYYDVKTEDLFEAKLKIDKFINENILTTNENCY